MVSVASGDYVHLISHRLDDLGEVTKRDYSGLGDWESKDSYAWLVVSISGCLDGVGFRVRTLARYLAAPPTISDGSRMLERTKVQPADSPANGRARIVA